MSRNKNRKNFWKRDRFVRSFFLADRQYRGRDVAVAMYGLWEMAAEQKNNRYISCILD